MVMLDMLSRINDKLLHFLACLAITLTAGELCAVTAGVTKEAADWMYKKLSLIHISEPTRP